MTLNNDYYELLDSISVGGKFPLTFGATDVLRVPRGQPLPKTLADVSRKIDFEIAATSGRRAIDFDAAQFAARTAPTPADPPKPATLTGAEIRERLGWSDETWAAARQAGFPVPSRFRVDTNEPLWTPDQVDFYLEHLRKVGAAPSPRGWFR